MSEPEILEKRDRKVVSTADLLRRGASLLRDPCPRCGGLQVHFNNRVYCINEDDIEAAMNPDSQLKQGQKTELLSGTTDANSEREAVRKLLRSKLTSVTKELQDTSDIDKQSKLLDLVSKYVEILSKLDSSAK